jgi:hypothetical protein
MSKNKYLKKKFPQLGDELNKMDYIILTYANCITLYSRLSYNSLAIHVGQQILDHIYFNKYVFNKLPEYKIITKDEFKRSVNMDNVVQILKLGDFFMSILQQFPHEIFNRKVKLDSYYTNEPYFLEVNKEYLEDIKNNIIINPNTLPMICPPNI